MKIIPRCLLRFRQDPAPQSLNSSRSNPSRRAVPKSRTSKRSSGEPAPPANNPSQHPYFPSSSTAHSSHIPSSRSSSFTRPSAILRSPVTYHVHVASAPSLPSSIRRDASNRIRAYRRTSASIVRKISSVARLQRRALHSPLMHILQAIPTFAQRSAQARLSAIT